MPTDALRALARELAPLIAEELGLDKPSGRPAPSAHGRYDHRTIVEFLSPLHLGDSVLLRARTFFGRLAAGGSGRLARARRAARPEGPDEHPGEPHQPAQEARRPAEPRRSVGGDRRSRGSHGVGRPRRDRRSHARRHRGGDRATSALTPPVPGIAARTRVHRCARYDQLTRCFGLWRTSHLSSNGAAFRRLRPLCSISAPRSHFRWGQLLAQGEVPVEERCEPVEHGLLLDPVAVVCREARDRAAGSP